MPLFEYLCADCGSRFETIVRSRDTLVACAHCASSRVEKQLSVFAVAGPKEDAAPAGCGRCGAEQPGMCQM